VGFGEQENFETRPYFEIFVLKKKILSPPGKSKNFELSPASELGKILELPPMHVSDHEI